MNEQILPQHMLLCLNPEEIFITNETEENKNKTFKNSIFENLGYSFTLLRNQQPTGNH